MILQKTYESRAQRSFVRRERGSKLDVRVRDHELDLKGFIQTAELRGATGSGTTAAPGTDRTRPARSALDVATAATVIPACGQAMVYPLNPVLN